jgi:hypothetical protein
MNNNNINTVYFGFEKQPYNNIINDENKLKLKKSSIKKIKCNKCNNIIEIKIDYKKDINKKQSDYSEVRVNGTI